MLVDTGVLVGYLNERDACHERADELMEELMEGAHGTPFVSDYVLDESYTLIQARTGRPALAARLWPLVQRGDEGLLVLEFVTPDDFWETRSLLERLRERPLSFTKPVPRKPPT